VHARALHGDRRAGGGRRPSILHRSGEV
jgi:hypothetical protein